MTEGQFMHEVQFMRRMAQIIGPAALQRALSLTGPIPA